MVLTWETEVLGEKHYTAWVVDGWMSTEQWCNGTDRGNRSTGTETFPNATLSTTNLTWTDLGSNTSLRGVRPTTDRLSHVTAIKVKINLNYKIFVFFNSSSFWGRTVRPVTISIFQYSALPQFFS